MEVLGTEPRAPHTQSRHSTPSSTSRLNPGGSCTSAYVSEHRRCLPLCVWTPCCRDVNAKWSEAGVATPSRFSVLSFKSALCRAVRAI